MSRRRRPTETGPRKHPGNTAAMPPNYRFHQGNPARTKAVTGP